MKKFTTSILLLIACIAAQASVIAYTPANTSFGGTGYLFVDINNDGLDDFLLESWGTGVGDFLKIKGLTAGSKMLTDGAGKCRGLNDSIVIGSNFPANLWADSSDIYRWDGGIYPFPMHAQVSLPVQISISGSIHYGYIYSYAASFTNFSHFQLAHVAYESIPGNSIKAAAMGGSTGIQEELEQNLRISVAHEQLNIHMGHPCRGTIEIYDLGGRKVNETSLHGPDVRIPTGMYVPGIYLLRMVIHTPKGAVTLTRKLRLP